MITSIVNGDGTSVYADEHRLCIITPETEPQAVKRFIVLCTENSIELELIGAEYDRCVASNIASNGQGKSYPVFTKRERVVSRLLREAGIKGT